MGLFDPNRRKGKLQITVYSLQIITKSIAQKSKNVCDITVGADLCVCPPFVINSYSIPCNKMWAETKQCTIHNAQCTIKKQKRGRPVGA